jgi:dephospho-CoA kinase
LDVILINADLIGHKTYEKGTDCYQKSIKKFGDSIVAEDGDVNRRQLVDIIIPDKSKMNELT